MSKKKKKSKNKNYFDKLIDEIDLESNFSVFEVVIIVFISIIFGIIIGYLITTNRNVELSKNSKLNEFISTYNKIKKNYYKDIDEDKLIDSAINGMVSSLDDDHSMFLNETNSIEYNRSIDGEYVGIGITIQYSEEQSVIIDVKKDSPADKAGVKVNDILLKINDTDADKIYEDNFIYKAMGKAGNKVKLTIKRDDKEKVYSMKSAIIELDSVSSEMKEDNIGYIKISAFSSNTYKQFNSHLLKLEKDGMKSLIIDVRDNLGGNLLQARQVLSMFFNKNTVLYQVQSNKTKKKVYSTTFDSRNYKVVVIANGNTASPAEVLVSCFKEKYKNGIVVGEKTYGKGTIQKTLSLSTGSNVKYTTNYWFTANGEAVDGLGIKPDFEAFLSSENPDDDLQLKFALDKIKES